MSNIIEINNLWKTFRLYHEKKTTLYENLAGFFYGKSSYEDFVALKDINLKVEKGECIGIIGANGSGKSTLLKIIAKILKPTKGKVKVHGSITPFLELGIGFQPELTARDNIILYGIIMGMPEKEITKRVDSVIEFAGLEQFKDVKIKNFSSGMYVRLAFSTAIQTDPEILLTDEVLAVGDAEFQQKCFDVFKRYKEEKRTILLVTHNLGVVRQFCDKALLLDHGEMIKYGESDKVVEEYEKR